VALSGSAPVSWPRSQRRLFDFEPVAIDQTGDLTIGSFLPIELWTWFSRFCAKVS